MPTTEMQEARMARLPAWARNQIVRLERDLADANALLSAGDANSDTIADPFSDAPRPLGSGTRVEFVVSRRYDGLAQDYIQCHIEDGTVTVRGSEGILVSPRGSNIIDIRLTKR